MTAQAASESSGTFTALKNSNFRLYVIGQLISISGTWMQAIAQGYLVFQLTHSEAWLGIVACAAGLPVLMMIPVVGVIVDRLPRRGTVIVTQAAQLILALILALLTLSGVVQVWHVVLLAFLSGITNAIYEPARQILIIEIVGQKEVRSGIAVNSILGNTCRILGPAGAGIALVQVGPGWCFLFNAISFLGVIAMLWIMKVPYPIRRLGGSPPIEQMIEGFRFARKHQQIAPMLLMITVGGLFLSPITNMLPAFADVVLHSPDQGLAALTVGQGVGAIISGLVVGWLTARYGYGRIAVLAAIAGSLLSAVLAAQSIVPMSTAVAAFCSFWTTMLYIAINTMLQIATPDVFRGRVLALYTLSYLVFAPFGALILGFVASALGISAAFVIWGVVGGMLAAAIVLRWPTILELNSEENLIEFCRTKLSSLSARRKLNPSD